MAPECYILLLSLKSLKLPVITKLARLLPILSPYANIYKHVCLNIRFHITHRQIVHFM